MAPKPDLTEFFKLSRPKRPPCQVAFALGRLGDEEQAAFAAACKHDPGVITNAALQGWLSARKSDVSIGRIVSHRKGTCTCYD